MSEYQYYEFLAIDRPLTAAEIRELRALSTRAVITRVSFANDYQWGDFKGDPDRLMERYFDAHVYVANWMTAIFKVRVPVEALSQGTVEALSACESIFFKATKTHWIVTWQLEESEDDERFALEDGRGWMARLSPVRDELLRGDLRSLYIGWLADVGTGMVEDDEMEPLRVSGLGQLTPAQQALAEFLEIDEDLLDGAAMGSPSVHDREVSQKDVDAWIAVLPRQEPTEILKQLLSGRGQEAERAIQNRFAAWRRESQGHDEASPGRTAGALRTSARDAEKIRAERKRQKRVQREGGRRKEREVYLKNLFKNSAAAWKSARRAVERGSGAAYDEAARLLVDLSEAYKVHAGPGRFQEELKKFMSGHARRKALVQRLVKAGIWEEK
ncbi:MAG: hypothetical protein A4E67_00271 [Syntrophaceae bacterium PtaB.Bin038]|nr:MAG: hypothetical protein A4E67_00271 [Syntrophaceae bacterium PtaB.Bin038]